MIETPVRTEARASSLKSLEQALAHTEQEVVTALGAVTKLQNTVKALRRAAQVGDLKALHRGFDAVQESMARAAERLEQLPQRWSLSEADEEQYLASGEYATELLAAAREANLGLYQQESYFACYPSLLKVLPRERAVSVDRRTYRPIRPSHLITHLSNLQK